MTTDCAMLGHPIVDGRTCPCGTVVANLTVADPPTSPTIGASCPNRLPAASPRSYAALFSQPDTRTPPPATSPRPVNVFKSRRQRDLSRY